MARCVLALDPGTTSSRAILLDEGGHAVGIEPSALAQSYRRPGWVEHDALEIWDSQIDVARGLLSRTGVSARARTSARRP